MENSIRLLLVKFRNQITHDEIKLFRGAVIQSLRHKDILFHNHKERGLRYLYPLIQYKRIGKCATIICINEGIEAIKDFLSNDRQDFKIGKRRETMVLDCLIPEVFSVEQTERHIIKYRLTKWLPLNTENYNTYFILEGMAERINFLEKILTANILSYAKGLNIYLDQQLICKIQDISKTYPLTHKGIRFMAFDIVFTANITLPDYIGIGKNASMGCGIIKQESKYYIG